MVQQHGWSYSDLMDMIPFEKDLMAVFLLEHLKKQRQ